MFRYKRKFEINSQSANKRSTGWCTARHSHWTRYYIFTIYVYI